MSEVYPGEGTARGNPQGIDGAPVSSLFRFPRIGGGPEPEGEVVIASIPKRFALVTKSVITLVAGFGLFVAASLVPAGIAAAEDGDWRWPGPPQGRCAESAPAAHLDVYVEGSREPVGLPPPPSLRR